MWFQASTWPRVPLQNRAQILGGMVSWKFRLDCLRYTFYVVRYFLRRRIPQPSRILLI
jgi:hypothetical protein